ncbi:MAG: S8 family serine peptidase, partial [Chitinophagales bacterium]
MKRKLLFLFSITFIVGHIYTQVVDRGATSEYMIDGVHVSGALTLPQEAIDKLEIITGLPPSYGDNGSGLVMTPQFTNKYWIFFTDKINSPYSKNNPQQFLTQRSIDRRKKSNIGIFESDLPVNTAYIEQLKLLGISVEAYSRWMNAVTAHLTEDQIIQIAQLPFVKEISVVKKYITTDRELQPAESTAFYKSGEETDIESIYGTADRQITMINLDTIFDLGFTGEGMIIAQLDAGYFGVDTAIKFQSLWDKDQIIGFYNFPDHNNQVFNIYSGYHGSWVLSVMGSDVPDEFSGTAPDAEFYLYRTEIADSEYVVEEDYWMMAAERADSMGADIINSSLGYTEFDDSLENHTYADLDGNTTLVTKAADMAAQKGILVCNSAGNNGWDAWHYLSAPSDGDSVFCIGAVDSAGLFAGFSGFGPSADGDVKPNVAAMGVNTACYDPGGYVAYLSGTSLSSPVIAGACASLWSAFP